MDNGKPRVSIQPPVVGPDDPFDGPSFSESVLHEGEAEDGRVPARVDHRRRIIDPEGAQSNPLCLQSGFRRMPLHASSVTQPRVPRRRDEDMRPNFSP